MPNIDKEREVKNSKSGERKNTLSAREKIAETLGAAKELTLDVAKLTLYGTGELMVENYMGIREYTEEIISLTAKPKNIRIFGKELEIKAMSREIIYVSGFIKKIEYV